MAPDQLLSLHRAHLLGRMSVYHPWWNLAASFEGSHCFGRAVWNRGASNRGFQGRRSRFEVWVIHLIWTIIFDARGDVMGFQGNLKIPGGEWNRVPM